jgi:hypothetical protein
MPSPTHLFLITTNPGSPFEHWGLFLASPEHNGLGTHYEIVVAKDSSCRFHLRKLFRKRNPRTEFQCKVTKDFSLERFFLKGGALADTKTNCFSTPRRVEEAVKQVMGDFKYAFLTQNCQTFAIEVVKQLAAWDRQGMVTEQAVQVLKKRKACTTRAKRTPGSERPRFTEMSDAEEQAAYGAWDQAGQIPGRFVEGEFDLFDQSVVLPRDDGVRGGRRVRASTRETSGWAERTLRRKAQSEPVGRVGVKVHARMHVAQSMPGAWVD